MIKSGEIQPPYPLGHGAAYNKTDLTGLYIVFLSFAQNIDCGYLLEPPTIYILSKMYTRICLGFFLSENCLFFIGVST